MPLTGPILILGATSAIARALARELAARGCALWLTGRDTDALEGEAVDLRLRHGVEVRCFVLDALDRAQVTAFTATLPAAPRGVVLAFGSLEAGPGGLAELLELNLVAPALLLEDLSQAMLASDQPGFILGLGSLAGLRGRPSNYPYGAAKGGLEVLLSGLRARHWRQGLHVCTALLGFVATPMTAHLALPPRLTASPERVATLLVRALERRRNRLYVPGYWRLVGLLLRVLPEVLFKRLRW